MADDNEFSRVARAAKRKVFGGDINLPDENPQRRSDAAMKSLQRFATAAQKLNQGLNGGKGKVEIQVEGTPKKKAPFPFTIGGRTIGQ